MKGAINKRRAMIKPEEFELAVEYFKRRLLTYEEFEPLLYSPEQNPATQYESAVKAFKKSLNKPTDLYEWADQYVNYAGWSKFKARLRQQKRIDSRKNQPREIHSRDFSLATLQRFERVKSRLLETQLVVSNDDALNYLIDEWEAN